MRSSTALTIGRSNYAIREVQFFRLFSGLNGQELKTIDSRFPATALADAGSEAVWKGEPSWNGVAILARGRTPVLTRDALPGSSNDRHARYIEAACNGVIVGCLCAPNGNPRPGPKYDYKLDWTERLVAHAQELWSSELPIVLAGDFNIVPEPRDIYATTSYKDNALVQPESRALFQKLLEQGWTDAIRRQHPEATIYTFWDYMRNRWQRNAGLRLDHLLLSRPLARKLKAAGVNKEVRCEAGAIDHAPAWIHLSQRSPANAVAVLWK